MNIANRLTLFRLLLVPVFTFAVLLDVPGGSYIGAVVFAIASITDGLDGYLARTRRSNEVRQTDGSIADKLLITAALLYLVQLHQISAWAALLIIERICGIGSQDDCRIRREIISASSGAKRKRCARLQS